MSNSPGYTGSVKHNVVTVDIMTFCCHVIMSLCCHVFFKFISLCYHVVLSPCPPVIMAHVVILFIMSVCHMLLYHIMSWHNVNFHVSHCIVPSCHTVGMSHLCCNIIISTCSHGVMLSFWDVVPSS